MTSESALVPYSIEKQIHLVRGQKVFSTPTWQRCIA